ncbi:hypothetical protein APSETT444_006981 [Aspergillus pseudonomiae]
MLNDGPCLSSHRRLVIFQIGQPHPKIPINLYQAPKTYVFLQDVAHPERPVTDQARSSETIRLQMVWAGVLEDSAGRLNTT